MLPDVSIQNTRRVSPIKEGVADSITEEDEGELDDSRYVVSSALGISSVTISTIFLVPQNSQIQNYVHNHNQKLTISFVDPADLYSQFCRIIDPQRMHHRVTVVIVCVCKRLSVTTLAAIYLVFMSKMRCLRVLMAFS